MTLAPKSLSMADLLTGDRVPPSPTTTSPSTLATRLEQACVGLLAAILIATPLFFYTETQDQFELPKLVLLRLLSSLLIGAALASRALSPRSSLRRTPLDWPLLAFSWWLMVKTLSSVSPALSWRGEYENFAGSLTQLNYSLLFFLSAQFVSTWARARVLAQALLAGALGAAAYGLLQACQRDFIQWAAESFVSNRFFGSLGNPNFLAGLVCMAIPLKLALAWDEQRRPLGGRDWAWWTRVALLAAGVMVYLAYGRLDRLAQFSSRNGEDRGARLIMTFWVLGIGASLAMRKSGRVRIAQAVGHGLDLLVLFKALANTGTRGGFLGLMVGLTVMALGWLRWKAQGQSLQSLLPKLGAALASAVLLLSLAFMGLGPSFRERVGQTLANPAFAFEASRLQIWVPALKIWKDHPLTGTGVDTFKSVFPSYSTSRFNRYDGENVSSRMAHCEPLQVLATMGAIGLVLWLTFCGVLFGAWWRRLGSALEEQESLFLLGIGSLLAAYLAQNLVSFGVSAITVPFFIAASLLFAGDPEPSARPREAWSPSLALGLGLAAAAAGAWQASRTWVADKDYALAFQIHRQMQSLSQSSTEEALGMAGYGVQQLQAQTLPADSKAELDKWLPILVDASQRIQAAPARAAEYKPILVQGGGALLYTLAALKMEQAVALCPTEVKYQIYRGLAYEELLKRTFPERRGLWFEKARLAYERSVEMNPQNAYYHGNLGRIYGLSAEAGNGDFMPKAEEHYLDAIRIAPVTRIFYENLLLLYARYARLGPAAKLMDSLQARDKEMAPSVLIAAASTFYQWRNGNDPHWNAASKKAAMPLIVSWARRCIALVPKEMTDPRDQATFADYSYSAAVFEYEAGNRAEARAALNDALIYKPKDEEILRFKKNAKL